MKEVNEMTNYREILRLQSLGLNNSQIADACGYSRTTVIKALELARANHLSYPLPEGMSDKQLAEVLFPASTAKPEYKMPDYEYVAREMQKSGVTLNLLWLEYCEQCSNNGETPYQLTQFKKYYRDYTLKNSATMHLNHKPGEIIQVDWAGDTAAVVDTDTGEIIPVYVFVATLPYSGYSYVEGLFSMGQECWTAAHVNAFRYFGGVARIIQCDNLKTGVDRHGRNEVKLNKAWLTRKNNHLNKLIKNARFSEPNACVEDISYSSGRKLDKAQIARLASCNFIYEHHNLMLLGATGCGKTYIACALGMAAVRQFLTVQYIRLPELLSELAISRTTGTFCKTIDKYKKPALLILDEWLLYQLKENEARDLLEIAEARYKKGSIIFCSQFDVPGWRDKIGSPIIADAICDRIVHDSYRIVIECEESMRKVFGVDKADA